MRDRQDIEFISMAYSEKCFPVEIASKNVYHCFHNNSECCYGKALLDAVYCINQNRIISTDENKITKKEISNGTEELGRYRLQKEY